MEANKIIQYYLSSYKYGSDIEYFVTEVDGKLLIFCNCLDTKAMDYCFIEYRLYYKDGELTMDFDSIPFYTKNQILLLSYESDLGYRSCKKHKKIERPKIECDYKKVLYRLIDNINLLPVNNWNVDYEDVVKIKIKILGEKELTVEVHGENKKISLPNDISVSWPDEENEYWAEQGFEQSHNGNEISEQVKNYCNLFNEYLYKPKSARF